MNYNTVNQNLLKIQIIFNVQGSGANSLRLLTSDSEAPNRPPRKKKLRGGYAAESGVYRRRSVREDTAGRRGGREEGGGGGVSRRKSVRSVKRSGTLRKQQGGPVTVGSLGQWIFCL